jgi:uncharacterized membrane protein
MKSNSSKRIIWVVAIVGLLVVAVASAFALNFPGMGKYEKVKVSGGAATIPVSNLADGKAHFFKIEDGGKEIVFFAVKAADGTVKTAFDACDSCFKSRKGYEQQGDKMNCKNCNQKFAINRLGPNATGGCNPGYLPHQLKGNIISISLNDLKDGVRYF